MALKKQCCWKRPQLYVTYCPDTHCFTLAHWHTLTHTEIDTWTVTHTNIDTHWHWNPSALTHINTHWHTLSWDTLSIVWHICPRENLIWRSSPYSLQLAFTHWDQYSKVRKSDAVRKVKSSAKMCSKCTQICSKVVTRRIVLTSVVVTPRLESGKTHWHLNNFLLMKWFLF